MRLHELVQLRAELEQALDKESVNFAVDANYKKLSDVANLADDKYLQIIKSIASNHRHIKEVVTQNSIEILSAITEIDGDIQKLTAKFFTANYQMECRFADAATVKQYRQLPLPEGAFDVLISRIRLYTSWKYPCLEIGCRDGSWTRHLVSCDPLYISDEYDEFINDTNNIFPKEYQARLRKYLIKDFKIANLPKNQFGFIFSFNYFNYLSLDTIKQFLLQANEWLRPGGVVMFTYNNADLSASAGMSESYFMTYVPKRMLIPLVESLGFEIISSTDILPSTSWIEFKKPGTLSTVKAHQTMGEIKFKDI